MIEDGKVFVRNLDMPLSVRGVTTPNPDGSFSVYINAALPEDVQRAALEHELYHIEHDHLYNFDSVARNEMEANCKAALAVEPSPAASATPKPRPRHQPLRLPTVSARERKRIAVISQRLDKEWAQDYKKVLAELEDRWLFDVG